MGSGLGRNVQSGYRWLAGEYRPGDRIFLFGFSRGAYTVRSLAGMIACCGLLDLRQLLAAELLAFELAVGYDRVTGIDFTARMIRIAAQLQEKGYTQYTLPTEGEIVSFHQANLQDLGLDGTRGKVAFTQGDLSNLKAIHSGFDLILLDTALERSYNPAQFLQSVHERLELGEGSLRGDRNADRCGEAVVHADPVPVAAEVELGAVGQGHRLFFVADE